ncbi:ester cyclase [Myceligenerans pegani]|uniref:Nuclear transport factor 2 family protein n=1 Tax=Myceligenerans pegani TaxID=2776917 RepID=A0ABR9N783_9MICO|nr:nuclear transport factor 2 family protein [Myceligenerans sp. TRM 65318]MBE1878993.1 nuclear transport factor 2 family protein [Myceligenerans sp. TRM 65318]MBE3021264.1 nuclear transport factor 2 family protein [Myceligenerans sp. TRM 65318]
MTDTFTSNLADTWISLWNGDLTVTSRILSPQFVSHAAPLTGGASTDSEGREAFEAWVRGAHEALRDLRFSIERGPFRDGDMVIIRWRADATYPGGIPGASAEPGTSVGFFGADLLRLDGEGRIVEYWVHSDSLWFVQQLGLSELPSLEAAS